MRHRKSGKTLGRKSAHRTAMFRNMARALLTYERIRTTEVKAKELRKIMDKLVTLALKDDLHARRQAYKILGNHGLVKKLFDEMAPKFSGGTGGYTRIIKLALPRKGDCAPMAIIEFAFVGDVKAEEPASTPAPTEAPSEEPKVRKPPLSRSRKHRLKRLRKRHWLKRKLRPKSPKLNQTKKRNRYKKGRGFPPFFVFTSIRKFYNSYS